MRLPRLRASLPLAAALGLVAGLCSGPGLEAREIDYLIPDPAWLAAASPGGADFAPTARCLGCGVEVVDYTDFRGIAHKLNRYPGRHVALLFRDDRPPDALTPAEMQQLLDLLDLAYEAFTDLVGGEPAELGVNPPGLLQIAFVPAAAAGGGGRAWLGAKGIEIVPEMEGDLRRPLWFDGLHSILLHEMAHNFDFHSEWLHYLYDQPHAWTAWIDYYMPYLMRTGDSVPNRRRDRAGLVRPPRSPRETLRLAVEGMWRPIAENPDASWERCVRRAECEWWESQVWGAFHVHLASQLGVQATRRFMRSLNARKLEGALPPGSPEAAEEVYLEAWGDASRSDVTCYAEALRWHFSDDLRARLRGRYGARAPLCSDRDGDGVRPIEGDCDDRDSSVRPGREDPVNGVDDDCDGHLDEVTVRQAAQSPQKVPYPSEVRAQGPAGEKHVFTTKPGRRTVSWVQACYRDGNFGYFTFLRGASESIGDGAPGDCFYGKVATRRRQPIRVRHINSGGGRFDFLVAPGDPWPMQWAKLGASVAGPSVELRLVTDLSALDEAPTHVRFWVSGTGWVATRAFEATTRVAWAPPPGAPAGRYAVRAQLLRDGVPVSQVSPMTIFEIGRPAP